DKMRAIADMLNKFNSKQAGSEKPRLTPTGQRETINGYDTEQYTYDGPDFKATYWIAPNYPNGAAVLTQLQSIKSEFWDAANTKMPDFRDFPGLPIRMRMIVATENLAGGHGADASGHPTEIISTITGVAGLAFRQCILPRILTAASHGEIRCRTYGSRAHSLERHSQRNVHRANKARRRCAHSQHAHCAGE